MNRRTKTLVSILVFALVSTGVWGYNQYQTKIRYMNQMSNQYQRLFYDMKDNIETVQTSIEKALLSESKEQNVLLLSQIWQQSYFAQDKLSQLPINHKNLSKTSKFLNQVSDYSYALIQNYLEDEPPDNKQRQQLFKLQDYTGFLAKELQEVHDIILKGNFNFNFDKKQANKKMDKANENMLDTRLSKYEEEQMTEYPELIYDGPFSDQILKVKPRGLGEGTVSEEEAQKIATKFIGVEKVEKISMFEQGGNAKSANIISYTFSIVPENKEKEDAIYIGVSKTGGKVVWMSNPRKIKDEKLSVEKAQAEAKKFLEEKGYKSMEPNYSLTYDGAVLFNFAYKQDNITIYTDLIKVKVALDDGEIIGFDASKYLVSHFKRDIPKKELTEEEARDKVRYDFDISNVRLAMIPDRGNNDVLCYEFRGTYKGFDFIVYINAINGKEQKILKIIQDEDGTLMI